MPGMLLIILILLMLLVSIRVLPDMTHNGRRHALLCPARLSASGLSIALMFATIAMPALGWH